MPEVFQLSMGPLTAAAFSGDRTQVAVCANNTDILIYTAGGPSGWTLQQTLSEHDKLVTAISWAPNSNRIVSCSQDRNAYVWTLNEKGEWKPSLVLLRINRAATCVKWSPKEDKFAVGSGARIIAVCSFDSENNWWVSKHLKKPLRSTVLSIDWHPNNVLLAAGVADMKARVFSAFIKGIDAKPAATAWGDKLPFNTVCGEFASPSGGWVHAVAFSPSGDVLAFAGHDSSLTILSPSSPGEPPATIQTIRSPSLPFVTLLFISDTRLIAAGHDCQPILFSSGPSGWSLTRSLDDPSASAGRPGVPVKPAALGGPGRLNTEAFNRFRQADSRGSGSGSAGGGGGAGGVKTGENGELLTVHQNTITELGAYEWGQNGEVKKFTTIGKDGRLCIWTV